MIACDTITAGLNKDAGVLQAHREQYSAAPVFILSQHTKCACQKRSANGIIRGCIYTTISIERLSLLNSSAILLFTCDARRHQTSASGRHSS